MVVRLRFTTRVLSNAVRPTKLLSSSWEVGLVDSNSCEYNYERLSMREEMDKFLGYSCSEIQAGLNMNGGDYGDENVAINMLCAQKLGDNLDLRDYHSIIVPYCTQDVHIGDNEITYDNGMTVHHRGARNMLGMLEWVYDNFPHPEHVILTGCSAGGTAIPIAHDLIYHHYNSFTKGKKVSVSSLLDSPVYLTPSYFMQNGMPNWNTQPMMEKIHFNYGKWGQSEEFSQRIIEHVLRRASNKDNVGLVTHNYDPISILYYEAMNGDYFNDDDDDGGRRKLEDGGGDNVDDGWWSKLSTSIDTVTRRHSNADAYILDGEGHCTFGLYYAQAEGGSSFQKWAGDLLLPRSVKKGSTGGRGFFFMSALMGAAIVAASIFHQHRMQTKQERKNDDDDDISMKRRMLKLLAFSSAFVSYYVQDSPVTIGYGVTATVYLICALSWNGFEDFLYNPSIGPSANTLSTFGINNPTLVVYHTQILRLVTSTFLCSGIITYSLLMFSLYKYTRPLERTMRSLAHADTRFPSRSFVEVAALVTLGSNIFYACFASGASCSSMTLVFGMQSFAFAMNKYHQQTEFSRHWFTSIMLGSIIVCLLPFNSWIMMTSSILLGAALAILVYTPVVSTGSTDYKSYADGEHSEFNDEDTKTTTQSGIFLTRKMMFLYSFLALLTVLFLLLLFRVRRPNQMYEQPFMTSCDLVYTTNVNNIVSGYYGTQFRNNDDDQGGEERFRMRWLEEQEEDAAEYMCAQLCLPHLVSRPAIWGANIYDKSLDVQKGQCEDVGYSQHIADKTYAYRKYSVDIELYYADDYNYYNENEND